MGGLEYAPLPEAWRPVTLTTYPFDLPDRRWIGMDYLGSVVAARLGPWSFALDS